MAIIKASKTFEGSNIDQTSLFAYIQPNVRQLKFDKKTNQDGLYVLFLPAYKQDSNGEGIWYKAVQIRNNFGADKIKKSYYVADPNKDPASYFERVFKGRFPEQAKVLKAGEGNNQTKFPIYPHYGHLTQRVVFNVGLLKELQASAPIDKVVHVLDLPAYKGADQLTTWMNTPQPDGTMSPLINDHEAAVAVFIKLVSEVSSQGGWTLSPSLSHRYAVPDAYADSANLYNLDNIFIEKSNDEIIGDLRAMYPANVFDICMDGFPGFKSNSVSVSTPASPAVTTALPVTSLPPVPPAPNVAPASTVTALPPPPTTAPAVQVTPLPPPPATEAAVASLAGLPANPIAPDGEGVVIGGKTVNKADLRAYLESKGK